MASSQPTLISIDQQMPPKKHHGRWIAARLTTEEKAELVSRYVAGETFDQLHDSTGFSVVFLRNLVRAAGHKTRGNMPDGHGWRKIHLPEDQIVARYQGGDTMQSIAKDHGVSEMTVRRVLIQHGISARRHPTCINGASPWPTRRMSSERRREVVNRYLAGETMAHIRQDLGVSCKFIRKTIIAAGFSPRARHTPTDAERRANSVVRTKRWLERHPEQHEAWQQSPAGKACNERKSTKYKATARGRAVVLVKLAEKRAAEYGFPFNITIDDILPALERGVCQATGIRLRFGTHKFRGGPGPYTASIDRLVPAIGYVPGNVQIVVWIYNTAKRHFPPEVVLRMARALVKQNRRQRVPGGASEETPPGGPLLFG